jgi:FAD:protein FMN transferase
MLKKRGYTAAFPGAGQSADLGGVGKGYAADRMLAVFRRHGVRSACLDFGGNVAVLSAKPDGSPWTVGVRHPGRAGELIGVLEARNESVVTSGDDQRAVTGSDGVRRSHILDPRTGLPTESGLLSVTVTAQSSAVADALATALFAAGMREGAEFLLRYPGAQAVFIDRDATVYLTRGLAHRFRAAQGIRTTVL